MSDLREGSAELLPEITQARAVLVAIITQLYKDRPEDESQREFVFRKDAEAERVFFENWLKTTESFSGSMKERVSMYIITALYLPTLNMLAHQCIKELRKIEKPDTDAGQTFAIASAFSNTWKQVELSLKERFDAMPEGEIKNHVKPLIESVASLFKTQLPPDKAVH